MTPGTATRLASFSIFADLCCSALCARFSFFFPFLCCKATVRIRPKVSRATDGDRFLPNTTHLVELFQVPCTIREIDFSKCSILWFFCIRSGHRFFFFSHWKSRDSRILGATRSCTVFTKNSTSVVSREIRSPRARCSSRSFSFLFLFFFPARREKVSRELVYRKSTASDVTDAIGAPPNARRYEN